MKIEVASIRENPLIGRREVKFHVQDSEMPKRIEARKELATILKAELDNVWVKLLETKTGTKMVSGLAHVYNNAEDALKVEPKHIIRRNQIPHEPEDDDQEE